MCDDSFTSQGATAACLSLGSKTSSSTHQNSFDTDTTRQWSKDEIPIIVDNVTCTASDTDFFSCQQYDITGKENLNGHCSHSVNILLTWPDIL